MKNKIFTKVVSIVMAGSMSAGAFMFGMPISAMAADQVFAEEGSATIEVSATVESGYTVKLPAALTLTDADGDNNFEASGVVGVKGNIASDKCIVVVPTSGEEVDGALTRESLDNAAKKVEDVINGSVALDGRTGEDYVSSVEYKNSKYPSKRIVGSINQQYVRFRSSHESGELKHGDARLGADHDAYTNSYVNIGVDVDEPGVYNGLIVYSFKMDDLK